MCANVGDILLLVSKEEMNDKWYINKLITQLILSSYSQYNVILQINVRENRKGNKEWTIQRHTE